MNFLRGVTAIDCTPRVCQANLILFFLSIARLSSFTDVSGTGTTALYLSGPPAMSFFGAPRSFEIVLLIVVSSDG
jgi:hypothetical protein